METTIPTTRWRGIEYILNRVGGDPDFIPFGGEKKKEQVLSEPILVIGAGGLGCELLKDLALMGFTNIHVIDMDTIDLSNLNRQFLFRQKDISRPKCEVAAEFINQRVAGVKISPHMAAIQDKSSDFYRQFKAIVCGLDSIGARRWINAKVIELATSADPHFALLIDGGTEALMGHVKVVVPTVNPCFECILPLFPPQKGYPICTIRTTPRLPEHCITWSKMYAWRENSPFRAADGEPVAIDADDANHMRWLFEAAKERASQFNIPGVTYKLTQGVIKNIIPAIASTNATIAAACANEVFKFVTECGLNMDNYVLYSAEDGESSAVSSLERDESCLICGVTAIEEKFAESATIKEVVQFFKNDARFNFKKIIIWRNMNLIYHSQSMEKEEKKQARSKQLSELMENGSGNWLTVYDQESRPFPLRFAFTLQN